MTEDGKEKTPPGVWERLVILLATGFGLGCSPVAPGTAGTLLGVVIVLAMGRLGLAWQIPLALVLAGVAVPLCSFAERHLGKKDDSRIVADEYLTFPICMLGLPVQPMVLAMAFVTNRMFDVIKPPPARQWQKFHGGVGVVVDDFFGALYSLALNHLLYRLAF